MMSLTSLRHLIENLPCKLLIYVILPPTPPSEFEYSKKPKEKNNISLKQKVKIQTSIEARPEMPTNVLQWGVMETGWRFPYARSSPG